LSKLDSWPWVTKRYHVDQRPERRKLPRHQTRRALWQKVPADRSRGIGGDEAADFDTAAKTNIPNDGFAKRVSGVSNDGFLRHPPPQTIDWNPISSRSYVVLRAMPIGNVAAGNASRAAHALEPSANVVRDIFKLSAINCESGFLRQRSTLRLRATARGNSMIRLRTPDKDMPVLGRRPPLARRKMLSQRNIAYRRTAVVVAVRACAHRGQKDRTS
jgi:hypothetical protein